MVLKDVYPEVLKCSKCGFCQPTCPTYTVSGREHEVARGRNQLVRAVSEGVLDLTRELKDPLFQCLMCNACYTNCFPAIKTDRVIAAARSEYIKRYGQPALQRYIFKNLLRNPARLGRYLKLASFGKRSGISGLVQVLRVLGWFGKNIANSEDLMETIPKSSLRDRIKSKPLVPNVRRGKIAYFVGCGINFAQPEVGLATIEIMLKRGFEVSVLPNVCCGLPAYAYGDLDSVLWFAALNARILADSDADVIVTDCGSCTSFLKEYVHIFDDNEVATEFRAEKVMDFTTWLRDTADLARFVESTPVRVTYHDPCHLAHHLKEKEAPRQVLRRLPSADFVELNESDFCCGGAGSYNIAHYDISMKILQRKVKNVESSGANVLTTACPACLIQLNYGMRKYKLPVAIRHLSQFVLERSE